MDLIFHVKRILLSTENTCNCFLSFLLLARQVFRKHWVNADKIRRVLWLSGYGEYLTKLISIHSAFLQWLALTSNTSVSLDSGFLSKSPSKKYWDIKIYIRDIHTHSYLFVQYLSFTYIFHCLFITANILKLIFCNLLILSFF